MFEGLWPQIVPSLGGWELNWKLQLVKVFCAFALMSWTMWRKRSLIFAAYGALAIVPLVPQVICWTNEESPIDLSYIPTLSGDPQFWAERQQKLEAAIQTLSPEEVAFITPFLDITFLHGTTSATFSLLSHSDWSLVPTGYLDFSVPFAGELKEGIHGVNQQGLSGAMLENAELAIFYATHQRHLFDLKREQRLMRDPQSNLVSRHFAQRRLDRWDLLSDGEKKNLIAPFPIVFASKNLQPRQIDPQKRELLHLGTARLGRDIQILFVPQPCQQAMLRSLEQTPFVNQIAVYTFADLRKAQKIVASIDSNL